MGGKYKKYGNYDTNPIKKIDNTGEVAFEGYENLLTEIKNHIDKGEKKFIFDFYPGVDTTEVINELSKINADIIINSDDCAFDEEKLNEMFRDNLTDDRVFGFMSYKELECCFDNEKIKEAKKKIKDNDGKIIFVIGTGASLIEEQGLYFYFDLARWEIQLRYRKGMSNWRCSNVDAPILSKYKRGFFVEWRLADRYKRDRFNKMDYIVDTNEAGNPKTVKGDAYRSSLDEVNGMPFRTVPYFDPGVWGGKWMKEAFELPDNGSNYAWSFDGVLEENSLKLGFGNVTVEIPAINLVLSNPKKLLGERVYSRFGAEFPIRFDLLDTIEGGNLSLQVHPLTQYIKENFGMQYTQDESYYFLDVASDDACIYLGTKENINKDDFIADLEASSKGEKTFPDDKYINKFKVKKHDHISIPVGTIHCSAKDTMVLEISATPYIFTFKLWDWDRLGIDGLPRPIHTEHGLKNIQWDRNKQWVEENLIDKITVEHEEDGLLTEKTGLHSLEFIETKRHTFNKAVDFKSIDSVRVLNLVDGGQVTISSPDNKFKPFDIHYCETFIVPASVSKYTVVPSGISEGKTVSLIEASVR